MQIAVTIALAVLYVRLSLTLGGVHSSNGPWWFFLHSSPPRRVHLPWRASVRLPAYAPLLLILWHFLSILRMHFDIDWVLYCVITLVLGAATVVALGRWREIRLLRSGEVAMAHIDRRENTAEWQDDRIYHHFRTASGAVVSGRAFYAGYDVPEGSSVPVFYDANNPRDHVAACASWFEAD